MGRYADRGAVGAASGCNWCAFVLFLFAVCSPYWSWGTYYTTAPNSYAYTTISQGPWVAGYTWTSIPYYSYPWYYGSISTSPVYWWGGNAIAACSNASSPVYRLWSGPTALNLCTNTPSSVDSNGTIVPVSGTPGMSMPTEVAATQAFSVMATVFCFFAAVLGCMDAGSDSGSRGVAIGATVFTFLTMVWSLAAWAQWAGWSYIVNLQSDFTPPGTPIWVNPATNSMSAVPVTMWLGPGWACELTAWILVTFALVIHCVSLPQSSAAPAFVPGAASDSGNMPSAVPVAIDKVSSV